MKRLGVWVAQRMRLIADRLDPRGAFRETGYSFRYKPGVGIVFHRGREAGCPLWYRGTADYERAYDAGWGPGRGRVLRRSI